MEERERFYYPKEFVKPIFYRVKKDAPYSNRVGFLIEDRGDKKVIQISGTFVISNSGDLEELEFNEDNEKRLQYYLDVYNSFENAPWIKKIYKRTSSKDGVVFLMYWLSCCTYLDNMHMAMESNRLYLDNIYKPDGWKDMCEMTSILTSRLFQLEKNNTGV